MRYTTESDIPGRLSLRIQRGLLDAEEAMGLSCLFRQIEGVTGVVVHESSGLVLVRWSQCGREEVLKTLTSLSVLDIPRTSRDDASLPHEIAREREDVRFGFEVARLVAGQLLRTLFLPTPLKNLYAIARGLGYVWRGIKALLSGRITVEVLDGSAIGISLLRGAFADASDVMFLLSLTDALERHVSERVTLALSENLIVRPETVWLRTGDQDVSIRLSEVEIGQVLHLRSGQVLPVDGLVVSGEGELNEATLTGEGALVHKAPGDSIYAGCALETGDLLVEVTAVVGRSRIDEIARMVEDSAELKAGIESKAEHLADALVPVSLASFVGLFLITRSIGTAMVVLMVDYSCAVRVATPLAVMAALGQASAANVIVKGGRYLEALAEADTVVFDKTGTLTTAEPKVVRVMALSDLSEREVLTYAACIEEHFPHSVARAIVREATDRGYDHTRELHAEVTYIVAHGIKTRIRDRDCCIGSAHFVFEDEGVRAEKAVIEEVGRAAERASIVYLAIDGELVGALLISDPVREEAPFVLERLRAQGIRRIVMLTGDSESGARAVAERLAIDEWHAQVLPEDKSAYVAALKEQGAKVIMVGDGINDSPALAAADVSVALADASDIARAVADICILDAHLVRLCEVRELSCALMDRIHTNYRIIVAFNSSVIVGGVCGLIPVTLAAIAHNLSTLVIGALSARPFTCKSREADGPSN